MNIEALLKCEVRDPKTGKLVSTMEKKCESFTIAFLQILEAYMRGTAATVSVRDIDNTLQSLPHATASLGVVIMVYAVDDDDAYGTIVGTGTTAPTNLDYVIETPIAHGVGAGQLDYNVQSFTTAGVVGPNVDFILTRTFLNGSGGDITVEEIGIYARSKNTPAGDTKYFLILRDVTGGVVVANGLTLTVTITLRTTV